MSSWSYKWNVWKIIESLTNYVRVRISLFLSHRKPLDFVLPMRWFQLGSRNKQMYMQRKLAMDERSVRRRNSLKERWWGADGTLCRIWLSQEELTPAIYTVARVELRGMGRGWSDPLPEPKVGLIRREREKAHAFRAKIVIARPLRHHFIFSLATLWVLSLPLIHLFAPSINPDVSLPASFLVRPTHGSRDR